MGDVTKLDEVDNAHQRALFDAILRIIDEMDERVTFVEICGVLDLVSKKLYDENLSMFSNSVYGEG